MTKINLTYTQGGSYQESQGPYCPLKHSAVNIFILRKKERRVCVYSILWAHRIRSTLAKSKVEAKQWQQENPLLRTDMCV